MKVISRFVSRLFAACSAAPRPRNGSPDLSFTAQPSPAWNGLSLGVMSEPQAR